MRGTSTLKNARLYDTALAPLRLFLGVSILLFCSTSQNIAAQTNVQEGTGLNTSAQLPENSDASRQASQPVSDDAPAIERAKKKLNISDDVPEGFESIGGPTNNIVDLIFNGQNLGTIDITGNDESIRFDNPTVVAYLLPNIKNAEVVGELLDKEFDSNVQQICFAKEDPPGCGIVDADPVSIIYDSGLLSVYLFLAADLQQVAQRDLTRYLSRPGEKQSAILSFNAVASDFQGQEPALDAATRGLVGYGNGYIRSEIDYNSSRDQFRLRDLSLLHFFQDHELQLGAFNHGGSGLLDIRLLGASFSSSLKARVDLDSAFSTQLTVYLVRRSVVQIVVDGRVYSGDSYDAGNQALDTRALPEGRYEVELKIIDPVSGSRSETRIFTKNSQLPPINESLYSFTAGVPLFHPEQHVFPKMEDKGVFGITWAKRQEESTAIELGLHQVDNQLVLHSKLTLLGKQVITQFGGAISELGTRIYSFQSSFVKRDFSAELMLEHTDAGDVVENTLIYDMFPSSYSQVGLALNRTLGNTVVGVSTRYSKQYSDLDSVDENPENVQYSFYLRRPLFTKLDLRGYVDGRVQKDEIGARASIQFRLFFDKPNWTTNVAYTAEFNEQDMDSNLFSLETSWRHTSANASKWAVSGFANRLNESNSLGSRIKLEHPRFQAALASEWTDASAFGDTLNSIASLSMHLGTDDLSGAFGGTDYAQSGVIVDVQGQPVGAPFDIIVNGIKYSAGQVGSAQLVGLQPFESYSIKLLPRGLLSNGIGESVYEISLFPGNIERITVVAQSLVFLVTELVRENGDSVGDAVVEIDGNPLLIDSGIFQGELPQGKTITIRPEEGGPCQFMVPVSVGEDVLVTESALICKATK